MSLDRWLLGLALRERADLRTKWYAKRYALEEALRLAGKDETPPAK